MKYVYPITLAVLIAVMACITVTVPAWSAEPRILEPAGKPTTEQLTIKTLRVADRYGRCTFVHMRSSLMDTFPAFLIDGDPNPKKEFAEYKISLLYGEILRASQLLPKDHPSKCATREFVAHMPSGKLDVGAYGGCEKDDGELRFSDAYYWDRENKKRMGREHKLKWDIAFRRLMWRTAEIASLCPVPSSSRKG